MEDAGKHVLHLEYNCDKVLYGEDGQLCSFTEGVARMVS